MKNYITSLFLIIIASITIFFTDMNPKSNEHTVERWKDGDTFVDSIGETHRILSCDTPEIFKPSCDREKSLGIKAKNYAENITSSVEYSIVNTRNEHGVYERGKFGRILSDITYINGGKLVNMCDEMISQGLASENFKKDWCSE